MIEQVCDGVNEQVSWRVKLETAQACVQMCTRISHMCSHWSKPTVHSSSRDRLVRIMYHELPVRRHNIGYGKWVR